MPDASLPDPNFWVSVWDLARTAGPFGTVLMLTMWYLERQERLKIRDLYDKLFERVLSAQSAGVAALDKFGEIISRKRQL